MLSKEFILRISIREAEELDNPEEYGLSKADETEKGSIEINVET